MDQSLRRQSVFVSNTPTAYVLGTYSSSDNVLNQTAFRSTSSSMMIGNKTRESEVPRYSQQAYAPNATFRASEQLMTTRTSSVLAIDRDISGNLFVTEQQYYAMVTEKTTSRPGGKPGGPAIGEATVPIGDVLLPMLLCAAMFVVGRSLRVWRTTEKNKI